MFQAAARLVAHGHSALPPIFFLHGNVAIGSCLAHNPNFVRGRGGICRSCGRRLTDSRLLYPVATKDYAADPLIARSWELVQQVLRRAYLFTIFGYSAPRTDTEAVNFMKEAWGDAHQRDLEEIETIDIKTDDELAATWKPFIHTHHYRTTQSFYDCLLGSHPRRTCEAVWAELMELEWLEPETVPWRADWSELLEWFRPLVEVEERLAADQTNSDR